MPRIAALICAGCLWAGWASAQSHITVTVDPQSRGAMIPGDFLGLSFEASNLLPNRDGGRLFDPANKPFLALFKTLGVKSLRIGGAMADRPTTPIPDRQDIDKLFAFAEAAGMQVIYTLRLPRADVEKNAEIAAYIQRRYASHLTCLEIGNEPDFYRRIYREIPDYPTYRGLWRNIAQAVLKAAPSAKFCGPAAGETSAWSRSFAEDFGKSGWIAALVQHEYTGGEGSLLSGAAAREAMLSRAWVERYDRLYNSFALAAVSRGLPYRLEETNNFTGGAKDASDTAAAALWALDYLHWWAAHGASGINFHNRRWILNTTIYPVNEQDDGLKSGYKIHPIGYGLKAFDLGSHGTVQPVVIASNPDAVNVTAYAVRDVGKLFVTLINKKDWRAEPREVDVTIAVPGMPRSAAVILLTAPDGDLGAKTGITLGGAAIDNGSWDGKWTPLMPDKAGHVLVKVPAAAAAVVRLALE